MLYTLWLRAVCHGPSLSRVLSIAQSTRESSSYLGLPSITVTNSKQILSSFSFCALLRAVFADAAMSIDVSTFVLPLFLLIATAQAYFQAGPLYGNDFGIPGQNASYDYVVVGGGTAGLALATRLAENTSVTVAVIEAGGFYEIDNGNTSVIPGLGLVYDATTTLLTNAYPSVDWGLNTTPQPGLSNQTFHYWRGRTLGGR